MPKLLPFTRILVVCAMWMGIVGCQRQQLPAVATGGTCLSCFAGPSTLSAQIVDWDVAAVARLVHTSPANGLQQPQATFEFVEVLKGRNFIPANQQLTVDFDGQATIGNAYLIVANVSDGMKWQRVDRPVSTAAQEYLTALFRLPTAAERQQFHLQHLTAADSDVSDDAFYELGELAHADLQFLRPYLDQDDVVTRLQNPDIAASRRRLYFRLLSICGSEEDLPLLEHILQSSDRKDQCGLDSAIACYLTLKGAAGLPLIEERFLRDKQADYAVTYSAIMALRTHLTDIKRIDRERLLASLRTMLERPELADLVIPDLAKFQDWTVVERLFELYQTADPSSTWIRVPTIHYLHECPLPRAKELLQECKHIDPAAVQRANQFLPATSPARQN